MKMETLSRDIQYLKVMMFMVFNVKWKLFQQLLNLSIRTEFVTKSGAAGHTDQSRTLEYFKTVNIGTRKMLVELYKYDFLLFDYDWRPYLAL